MNQHIAQLRSIKQVMLYDMVEHYTMLNRQTLVTNLHKDWIVPIAGLNCKKDMHLEECGIKQKFTIQETLYSEAAIYIKH